MNGIFAKIGHWYEEGYVVLQCLRMLAGRVDSVTWEAKYEDEKGIDVWLVEAGRRVAVQCKTRSTGSWTKSGLQKPLKWAGQHLERTDPGKAEVYRFVTEASLPPEWQDGCDARLADRLESYVVNERQIESEIVDLATVLASVDPRTLIYELGSLASKSLATTLSPQIVHDHLRAANVALHEQLDEAVFAARLRNLSERFLARLKGDRKHIAERVEREEVGGVLRALEDPRRGRQILVHAEGGAGKSQILGMVVERLEFAHVATLVVRADEIDALVATNELPDDPVVDLRRYVGDGRAVLVIDQLDQLAHAGAASQKALNRIRKWLLAAKGSLDVVLGCRTLEAIHASQIGSLLDPDLVKVEVGELPEAVPLRLLSAQGVPFAEISLEMQRWSRNPAVLECMLGLAKRDPQGNWRRARTAFEIIDHWWRIVELPHGAAAKRVVDRLVDAMEQDGVTEVDLDAVGGEERETLDALVHEGVLVNTGSRIRFAHQIHFDVRLSMRWRDYGSGDALLEALGRSEKQDLHKARQLRLTVPRWRGARGARILRDLMRSESVRPLLQHAALLGLAEVDGDVDDEIGEVVSGWLADDTFPFDVLALVIFSNAYWFDFFERRGWFDVEWTRCAGIPGRRDAILRVFASVLNVRNPEVARHLAIWNRDGELDLRRVRFFFVQDSAEDSDEFFELRMLLGEDTTTYRLGTFEKAVASNPERALRLLEKRLRYLPQEALMRGDEREVGVGWPEPTRVPAKLFELGVGAYDRLESWWQALEIQDLGSVIGDVDDSELARVVETLARCLAHAIQRREIDWKGVIDRLPNPQRDVDRWLLLETGANLAEVDAAVADSAVDWFMSDRATAMLEVGYGIYVHPEFPLPARFIRVLSPRISDRLFARLEDILIRHPGNWNASAEKWRAEQCHFNVISDFGYVAYRLLPALDASRLSPSGLGRRNSMKEKFDPICGERRLRVSSRSGWPKSPIPSSKAAEWSFGEWREKFLEADSDRSPKTTPNGLEAHDQGTLVRLLVEVARTRLDHVYSLALDLCGPGSGLDPWLRLRIAEDVASIQFPDPNGNYSAFALSVPQVESLLEPFLGNLDANATGTLNSIVDLRVREDWSDAILEDLALRTRCGSARSLEVLADIAAHHASARGFVVDLAGEFLDHVDSKFRDAAIRAAMSGYETHEERAILYALTAIESYEGFTQEPHNRAHVLAYLLWRQKKDDPSRRRILDAFGRLLSRLDESNVSAPTQHFMGLVANDRVESDRAQAVFRQSPAVRRSAADFVNHALDDLLPTQATLNWAIEFANDDDPRVREILFSGLRRRNAPMRLDDPVFRQRLLDSRGAKDDACRGHLIHALDARAELQPIAETILDVASGFTDSGVDIPTDEPWKRDVARQAMTAQLFRLVEECERKKLWELRKRVLDLVDRLILSKMDSMSAEVKARTL